MDAMTKAMYGVHAMHVACQIVLQNVGFDEKSGKFITSLIGQINSYDPILSDEAAKLNCPHELIVGDMIIRPHGKFASRKFTGYGLAGLVTSEAMFPDSYDHQTLDNGFSVMYKKDAEKIDLYG